MFWFFHHEAQVKAYVLNHESNPHSIYWKVKSYPRDLQGRLQDSSTLPYKTLKSSDLECPAYCNGLSQVSDIGLIFVWFGRGGWE